MNREPSSLSIDLNSSPENINSPNDNYHHSQGDVHIDLNQLPGEDDNYHNANMHRLPNKKKNISDDKKRAVFEMLLMEHRDGKLPNGVISRVAESFSISTRSVSRIW